MKSTDRILAKRYARAYDALSKDSSQAQKACEALCVAALVLKQAHAYMQDPAVQTAQKQAFVQELFGTDKKLNGFLLALLSAKRYNLLDACATEVQNLLDERLGIVRADVQTAFELTPAQKKQVEKTLSKFTGKTAQSVFFVEPELLGGLSVRMDDILIDGSLKGRFKKLQEQLVK